MGGVLQGELQSFYIATPYPILCREVGTVMQNH
jgi:hypothetical protein